MGERARQQLRIRVGHDHGQWVFRFDARRTKPAEHRGATCCLSALEREHQIRSRERFAARAEQLGAQAQPHAGAGSLR